MCLAAASALAGTLEPQVPFPSYVPIPDGFARQHGDGGFYVAFGIEEFHRPAPLAGGREETKNVTVEGKVWNGRVRLDAKPSLKDGEV